MIKSRAASGIVNGDVCFAADIGRANGRFRGIMMVRR
jgi:hypothetical protein